MRGDEAAAVIAETMATLSASSDPAETDLGRLVAAALSPEPPWLSVWELFLADPADLPRRSAVVDFLREAARRDPQLVTRLDQALLALSPPAAEPETDPGLDQGTGRLAPPSPVSGEPGAEGPSDARGTTTADGGSAKSVAGTLLREHRLVIGTLAVGVAALVTLVALMASSGGGGSGAAATTMPPTTARTTAPSASTGPSGQPSATPSLSATVYQPDLIVLARCDQTGHHVTAVGYDPGDFVARATATVQVTAASGGVFCNPQAPGYTLPADEAQQDGRELAQLLRPASARVGSAASTTWANAVLAAARQANPGAQVQDVTYSPSGQDVVFALATSDGQQRFYSARATATGATPPAPIALSSAANARAIAAFTSAPTGSCQVCAAPPTVPVVWN